MKTWHACTLAALVCLPPAASAQDPMPSTAPSPFPEGHRIEGVSYRPEIPTPEEVLGYRVGHSHTRPHQLVEYFRAVAAASDRVAIREHARSYEGRPLIHAVVTSPANHARLSQIIEAQQALTDDPASVSDEALAAMPVVVYMGYSVHGNEASGSEASLLFLYHLAAGQGDRVEGLLDSAVILVDPSLNPDGRSRFVEWVNGRRGRVATSDAGDMEHNEPWPGGRTNHYWFDLNRDWLPAQLPESQGRLAVFHTWRPHLLTDFHEMGGDATYFFQPGIPSRNNPYTPEGTFDLTGQLARFHSEMLDQAGSLYYTKQSFDDFYYGKGSTYPDVNGAVGILFEQASSRALRRITDHGLLSYERSILNQFLASVSSVEGARAMRLGFLRHQRDFYLAAGQFAAQRGIEAYLVPLAPFRTRAQELLATLRRHRIRVHDLGAEVTTGGIRYRPGEALLVPTAQPQARLLLAAMEPATSFGDSLFYDVSAWTLPLAFGVEVARLPRLPSGALGPERDSLEPDGGRLVGGRSDIAYVMEWGRYLAPRALKRLLTAGVIPLVATSGFETSVAGQRTPVGPGAIIIPVRGRDSEGAPGPEEVHRLVERMVAHDHVVIHAVESGLSLAGPDLGGESNVPLSLPSVGLVAGGGTSAYEVGEVWHLLDQRMGLPVSLLSADRLENADLSRYDRLVLVNGFRADSSVAAVLERWIDRGGVLLAQRGAARWAIESGLVDEQLREAPADSLQVPWADVSAARGAQQIGGTILATSVDTTHPIAFGMPSKVAVFRRGTLALEPSSQPGATVARYLEEPLLSGYISPRNSSHLAGTASIVARDKGRGAVVLFMDIPNFRAFWYGSAGFFLNAIFFGSAL